jgi:arabinofuranosyltransferase
LSKVNLKILVLFIFFSGLAAIFLSFLFTPSFIAKHFTEDNFLPRDGVLILGSVRFFFMYMGITLAVIGASTLIWLRALTPLLSRIIAYITRHAFIIIIIFFTLYCIVFIFHTSFTFNNTRYFTLFDDSMISMRYAKNLAQGNGLRWNPEGPRVEGYSNFLWTLYMTCWHLLSIDTSKTSFPIQMTGLIFLIANLFMVKRITWRLSKSRYVTYTAILLTATYMPIIFWALKGMSTAVLIYIVLLSIYRILESMETGEFRPSLFFILGIGMLIRVDFAFLFVAISVFAVVFLERNRKKNLATALSVFAFIAASETLFRVYYYGEFLPNTYYLKVSGVPFFFRFKRGLWMAFEFIKNMSPILFTLPFIYVAHKKEKKIFLLLYIFVSQLAYSIYVGGDAWEGWSHVANRFLCIVMPSFFILLSLTIKYLFNLVNRFFGAKVVKGVKFTTWLEKTKFYFFILLILLLILRFHGGISLPLGSLLAASGPHVNDDKEMVRIGLELKEITNEKAKIAVVWSGAIPYFSDRDCIDILGYNDKVIAHQTISLDSWKDFYPGHNKYDYGYSIGTLNPDIVAQLWYDEEKALEYLKEKYITCNLDANEIFLRKDSPNIKWSKIALQKNNQ